MLDKIVLSATTKLVAALALSIFIAQAAAANSTATSTADSKGCSHYSVNLLLELIRLRKHEGDSYAHERVYLMAELGDLLHLRSEGANGDCQLVRRINKLLPGFLDEFSSANPRFEQQISRCLEG